MADEDDELKKLMQGFKQGFSDLGEQLKRDTIRYGSAPSIQGALQNLGEETKSFFSTPDQQEESRRQKGAAGVEALAEYDRQKAADASYAGGGMSNAVGMLTGESPAVPKPSQQVRDTAASVAGAPIGFENQTIDPDAGGFKAPAAPAAPKSYAVQPRETPEYDPTMTAIGRDGSRVAAASLPKEERLAIMQGFNLNKLEAEREARTAGRQDFAASLDAAGYDPSTASAEDKAKFYAQGKELGLSSEQIDKYRNDKITAAADLKYRRENPREFLRREANQFGARGGLGGSRGLGGGSRPLGSGRSNIRVSRADQNKKRLNDYYS